MKPNNLNKNSFDIYKISNRIYLFLFNNSYDMCMHFVRYQENYESPKFRNKKFTILEFMDWYAKNFGDGVFTYTSDWGGFNIPSSVIWRVHASQIDDYNAYDANMLAAYNKISSITHLDPDSTAHDDFYILGTAKQDIELLQHELAHGLYATNKDYYNDINRCTDKLPDAVCDATYEYLITVGYCEEVLKDELQAYFATGLTPPIKQFEKFVKPFQKIFQKYIKKIDFDLKSAKPLQFR